jgi:hypothetical protein
MVDDAMVLSDDRRTHPEKFFGSDTDGDKLRFGSC